jgi:hypothetical protein
MVSALNPSLREKLVNIHKWRGGCLGGGTVPLVHFQVSPAVFGGHLLSHNTRDTSARYCDTTSSNSERCSCRRDIPVPKRRTPVSTHRQPRRRTPTDTSVPTQNPQTGQTNATCVTTEICLHSLSFNQCRTPPHRPRKYTDRNVPFVTKRRPRTHTNPRQTQTQLAKKINNLLTFSSDLFRQTSGHPNEI